LIFKNIFDVFENGDRSLAPIGYSSKPPILGGFLFRRIFLSADRKTKSNHFFAGFAGEKILLSLQVCGF
jgi:hypothetical protein